VGLVSVKRTCTLLTVTVQLFNTLIPCWPTVGHVAYVCGRCTTPDPGGGAYSAPLDLLLMGRRLAALSPRTSPPTLGLQPQFSALMASGHPSQLQFLAVMGYRHVIRL